MGGADRDGDDSRRRRIGLPAAALRLTSRIVGE